MLSRMANRKLSAAIAAAVLVYCLCGAFLIMQKPGLQYDEALTALGSIHMLHSAEEFPLPHDPHSWFCPFGRCVPLMTLRYAGAVKEYAFLPLYAVFGPRTVILRFASMLLGAVGIWGLGRLTGERLGWRIGAVAALMIAINPAYVNQTVFDSGVIAMWMCGFGVLCLAIAACLRRPDAHHAFWLGAAMGFAVWTRANFLWQLAAIFGAALIIARRQIFKRGLHWTWISVGGFIGAFPLILYEILSKGGTWEALGMFPARDGFAQRILTRLMLFSETLLSDREHRAMWDGPPLPAWQGRLFLIVVVVSCIVCLTMRSKLDAMRYLWARGFALTFLFLAAFLFLSRLDVSEHHLVALVPLAAVLAASAGFLIQEPYPKARIICGGLAGVYVACALYWQAAAVEGLRRTGGVRSWSDSIFTLARDLEQKYPTREIQIVDWGLQNSLYFLSNGRLHSREIFWDASPEQSGRRRSWLEEVRDGGVFLLNAPENRQLPVASQAFLQALAGGQPAFRRFTIDQRDGRPYVEIIEVEPNTLHRAQPSGAAQSGGQRLSATVATADNAVAGRLEGFHQIENGGWRWTKKRFSITIDSPDPQGQTGARFTLRLYVPDSSMQKLGAITLTARLGDHVLPPETFRRPGQFSFARDLDAAWVKAGPNRVDFTLDKALAPTASDGRELGIVVVSASLETR